jgi:hypothetical protein
MEEASMSEAATEQTPQEPAATETQPSESADLGDGGKKALDAERKRAATAEREAKALKTRLDELEKANLSELEKAQRTATEATARLAEYEKTMIRQRVALAKGVPADLVDRLRGDTEDEIAADADSLLALVKAPTTPKPDPSQGARGAQTGSTADQFASTVGSLFST